MADPTPKPRVQRSLRAFLTVAEAAKIVEVHDNTFRQWLYRSNGPPHVRLGRSVRIPYRRFMEWAGLHPDLDSPERKHF